MMCDQVTATRSLKMPIHGIYLPLEFVKNEMNVRIDSTRMNNFQTMDNSKRYTDSRLNCTLEIVTTSISRSSMDLNPPYIR